MKPRVIRFVWLFPYGRFSGTVKYLFSLWFEQNEKIRRIETLFWQGVVST